MENQVVELPQAFSTKVEENSYVGIRTEDVIKGLVRSGWEVDSASERATRKLAKENVYHVAKLSNPKYTFEEGHFNLVIANSNDGSSMFRVQMGMFRLVCANGLTIGDNIVEPLLIPHKGYLASSETVLDIIDLYLAKNYEKINQFYEKLKSEKVERKVIREVAKKAFELKHGDKYKPRRKEDKHKDLWSIYNVIQENLLDGNYEIIGANGEPRKARKTSSSKEDLELNNKLSDLIMSYV